MAYTSKFSGTEIDDILSNSVLNNQLLDLVYPIGSVYISINEADPSLLFGGSWVQIKDRFLLASGNNFTIGTEGGESEHTLTIDEIPAHHHYLILDSAEGVELDKQRVGVNNGSHGYTTTGWYDNTAVYDTGGGQSHNNMPPYLAVNMWYRTA